MRGRVAAWGRGAPARLPRRRRPRRASRGGLLLPGVPRAGSSAATEPRAGPPVSPGTPELASLVRWFVVSENRTPDHEYFEKGHYPRDLRRSDTWAPLDLCPVRRHHPVRSPSGAAMSQGSSTCANQRAGRHSPSRPRFASGGFPGRSASLWTRTRMPSPLWRRSGPIWFQKGGNVCGAPPAPNGTSFASGGTGLTTTPAPLVDRMQDHEGVRPPRELEPSKPLRQTGRTRGSLSGLRKPQMGTNFVWDVPQTRGSWVAVKMRPEATCSTSQWSKQSAETPPSLRIRLASSTDLGSGRKPIGSSAHFTRRPSRPTRSARRTPTTFARSSSGCREQREPGDPL